jgi:hypothetical protein
LFAAHCVCVAGRLEWNSSIGRLRSVIPDTWTPERRSRACHPGSPGPAGRGLIRRLFAVKNLCKQRGFFRRTICLGVRPPPRLSVGIRAHSERPKRALPEMADPDFRRRATAAIETFGPDCLKDGATHGGNA